jgi:hypothetical protein
MSTAAHIAQALAGRRAQRLTDGGYLIPCPAPGHGKGNGDRHPSLRISDGDTRVLVHCFSGCPASDVLDALRHRGLLDGPMSDRPRPAPRIRQQPHQPRKRGGEPWHGIWRHTVDAPGTPVEAYLAGRRLALPPDACEVIRFHATCPFGYGDDHQLLRTPAMVALVRNVLTDRPQAVHRTALNLSGHKVEVGGRDRMALGPLKDGAVKLTADECVTYALGIAEGIETALSLACLPEWRGLPVWSLISADGIESFPLLAGVETLVIAVDHDKAGEDAALAVAERWRAAEREVLLIEATAPGNDLNDILGEAP